MDNSSETPNSPGDSPASAPIDSSTTSDPVLLQRAAVLQWCDRGQRLGYLCFALSMVVFTVGFIAQFPQWMVTTIIVLMAIGSAVFLPAVIFGYAAKAAEKEDRGEKFGY